MATPLFTDDELVISNYNDQSYIIKDKDFYEMPIEIAYMNVSLFCYYLDKKDKNKGTFVFDFIDKLKKYIVSLIIYKLATDYFNDNNKTHLLDSLKAFDSKRLMSGTIFDFLKKLKHENDYKKLYSQVIAKEVVVEVAPREVVEPEIVPVVSVVVPEIPPEEIEPVVVEEEVLSPGSVDMAAPVAKDDQLNRLIQLIKEYISDSATRAEQTYKIDEILLLNERIKNANHPIIIAQSDIINHLSEIRSSYSYNAHNIHYISAIFKSSDFGEAKSKISKCLQYFIPVIQYILSLNENDKLNNICNFLLMLLNYDYNSIQGKKRDLNPNDDGKYLDFLKKISEAQLEDISSDIDVANIIKYVSYYLFEIYNEIPIPFAHFNDIQIIIGGDADGKTNNLIDMIILNTLNSILLFNDKQLNKFINNVNKFNKN